MTNDLKITIVEASEIDQYEEEGGFIFQHPAKFYFVNGLGQYIYVHTRDRQKVVDFIKEHYAGKYGVRQAKMSTGGGDVTCRGSNSRKGFAPQLKRS